MEKMFRVIHLSFVRCKMVKNESWAAKTGTHSQFLSRHNTSDGSLIELAGMACLGRINMVDGMPLALSANKESKTLLCFKGARVPDS